MKILNFTNLNIYNINDRIIKTNGIKRGHGFSVISALKKVSFKEEIFFIPLSIDSTLSDLIDILIPFVKSLLI